MDAILLRNPFLGFMFKDGTPCYKLTALTKGSRFELVISHTKDGEERDLDRFNLPLQALTWIYESIADGFWRSPEQGGFAKGVYHCEQEFDGEKIRINRMMNVGAPDQKGFMITNLSKMDPDLEMPMEIQIPDVMLIEGGLLEVFRNAQEGVAN